MSESAAERAKGTFQKHGGIMRSPNWRRYSHDFAGPSGEKGYPPHKRQKIVLETNPYSPPLEDPESSDTPQPRGILNPKRGPAVSICLGALLGLFAGVPLLFARLPIGFLGFMPGAILGGLMYRYASRHLPVDPQAHSRRWLFAGISLFILPITAGILTGMRGQGLHMTIGALLIGLAIAVGILVSGDRRPKQWG